MLKFNQKKLNFNYSELNFNFKLNTKVRQFLFSRILKPKKWLLIEAWLTFLHFKSEVLLYSSDVNRPAWPWGRASASADLGLAEPGPGWGPAGRPGLGLF